MRWFFSGFVVICVVLGYTLHGERQQQVKCDELGVECPEGRMQKAADKVATWFEQTVQWTRNYINKSTANEEPSTDARNILSGVSKRQV